MESTEWRPILGHEGRYEVSDAGEIRSLRSRGGIPYFLTLKPPLSKGYLRVRLLRETRSVHRAVAEAFHGSAPFAGAKVCHNNGNPLDNRASNLRWGTQSENILDSVRHGTHPEARKTHCPRNHEYSGSNLRILPNGKRRCRTCDADRERSRVRPYKPRPNRPSRAKKAT